MHTDKCAAVQLHRFISRGNYRLENCPTVAWGEECWHTALLVIKKKEEEKKKPLSAFVYHISEASITATMVWLTPERNWGARLVKQRWKLCLVVNVRTSLDHTHARNVLSVFYSATTDCCTETVNTNLLILIWTIFFFLLSLLRQTWHIYICLHLVADLILRRQRVTSCRTSMHVLYEQMQPKKSTSLPFLCFAIEYISTVSHCHSVWQ